MARIKDLPFEILIVIMSLLGKTCNGSANLAKAMAVCMLFKEAVNGVTDLRYVRFRNLNIQDQHKMYQEPKGLIYKCAKAGNASAQYLLAKVVLATCTQLRSLDVPKEKLNNFLDNNPNKNKKRRRNHNPDNNKKCHCDYCEKSLAASFLSHFNHSQEPESSSDSPPSHRKLVRVFLSNLTETNSIFMNRHLNNYVEYFTGRATYGTYTNLFVHFINKLVSVASRRWGTFLVLYQGNFYVKNSRKELIVPPPQLRGLGSNKEFVDWKYKTIVFEEVRKQTIYVFDLLANELH